MAYKKLLEDFNLTQDEAAKRVSKSRSAVTNSMRLLKLTPEVQDMVARGELSTGHARALIPVEDETKQRILASKIANENLSVRDTEKLIKDRQDKEKAVKTSKAVSGQMDAIYADIVQRLKIATGTKVNILPKANGSGKLEIEFYSNDDLDRIVEKLTR